MRNCISQFSLIIAELYRKMENLRNFVLTEYSK